MNNTDTEQKFVFFGAGAEGIRTLHIVSCESVAFFIDNDKNKQGREIEGKKVYSLDEALPLIKGHTVVITVSEPYQEIIGKQLENLKIESIMSLYDFHAEQTRKRISQRTDYIKIYDNAIGWIKANTVDGKGIINDTGLTMPYPEVTGYYIPTLMRWGYRDLALQYAKWLCSIQKADGSWYDTCGNSSYVFDSAQILKGLIAVRDIYPDADENIIKGCEWILSNMRNGGRLSTPDMSGWGNYGTCSEIIHLYCLSPIIEAGKIFGRDDYIKKAEIIIGYYLDNYYEEITNFSLLSHFYAYVMEAFIDIGQADITRTAMDKIAKLQDENGMVPAYKNVHWVCSTGMFQLALVWFRLGEIEKGNKAFEYACKLQNDSGGWFGGYHAEKSGNEIVSYFPDREISWANKYFLDALFYKNAAEFNDKSDTFLDSIDKTDGRYEIILEAVRNAALSTPPGKKLMIADVGCGKGRYLKNLMEDEPKNAYFAVDISEKVMSCISDAEKKTGTLTDIPYRDDTFDIVYTCEALEHAVDIESAIREMARVTKSGGHIVIIDKNKSSLGIFDIEEFEQWFDVSELKGIMQDYCTDVTVTENLPYNNNNDGLFCAWCGKVKKA